MLKMVDGTGIIGVDMVCPLGGAVSHPQPPNYDKVEVEGVGNLMLPNSLKAPLERVELIGNSVQGENPAPENPQEIKSAGKWNEGTQKYEIDVKVTGKNLIPDTVGFEVGSFNYNTGVNASLSDRGRLKEYIPIVPGKKYLVTVNGNTSIDDIGVHFLDINRFPVAGYGSARFISPLNAYYVCIRYKGWTENDKVSLQLQDTSLDYEPYTEQTVQIALDEPLRGIGEYKDVLTKDGVVRKIYPPYEINLNDLRDGGYSRTNTVMFSVKVQNKTVGYASLKPSILCNILPDCGLQTGNIYNDDKECIAVGGGIVLFRVNKSRLKDISSFEATKQSFIELMEGKKMLVAYALETSVTEPLPESVQAQLSSLHSENGVTHVFVDSGEVPCGIKVTYRKEK